MVASSGACGLSRSSRASLRGNRSAPRVMTRLSVPWAVARTAAQREESQEPVRRRRGGSDQVRCDTGATLGSMPTNRRRHAVTETPPVQAALDELRRELGTDRVELGELVVLGAGVKLAELRAAQADTVERRARLAERVRVRRVGVDVDAADEVRERGWARS